MRMAIDEARASLREGNRGFGAVVASGGGVLARAHDAEVTTPDPTAHAELDAIREAGRVLGGSLEGCVLVSTHEPCPMCAGAAVWAGLRELAFGITIEEALAEGRRRIRLPAAEVFERAGVDVRIHRGVLRDECAPLYDRAVRDEVGRLRGAPPGEMRRLGRAMADKRVRWFEQHPDQHPSDTGDSLEGAYRLLLTKLGVDPAEAPIVERTERRLVFHSANFCPTLEACRILDLDTRVVCRAMTEHPADALIRKAFPNLRFGRNYDHLRPGAGACEEIISIDE
jgi:tRNA(Arg) A34 adenosine deaminase TadA